MSAAVPPPQVMEIVSPAAYPLRVAFTVAPALPEAGTKVRLGTTAKVADPVASVVAPVPVMV